MINTRYRDEIIRLSRADEFFPFPKKTGKNPIIIKTVSIQLKLITKMPRKYDKGTLRNISGA